MGFAVDKRCLMNYDEVDGLIQAKKFDAKGKNVIFDEAHNLCRTMRREGMKYYPEVMARHHPDLEVMRDGSVVRRAPRR